MNYKIDITPKAQNDLEEIFRYIAFNLQSFINASNLLDRLEQAIYSLEQMPERFRLYDKEPWKSKLINNIDMKRLSLPANSMRAFFN